MKLTREQIINLNNGLHAVGNLTGVKFAYAVSRNIVKIKSEMNFLKEAFESPPDYRVYNDARVKLAESHAIKINGVPKKIQKNGIEEYVIKDKKVFNKELKILQKKYEKCIKVRKKQKIDFDTMLKKKVEIDLHYLPLSYIPETITPKQMTGILLIIDEENSVSKRQNRNLTN